MQDARRFAVAGSALTLLLWVTACWAAEPDRDDWAAKIRKHHPRLFFNRETWPAVKQQALGPMRPYYERMKTGVDGYPDDPQGDSGGPAFEREEQIAGTTYKMPIASAAKEWGPQAAETAFVYRMTGEEKYLNRATKMLRTSVQVYQQCYAQRRAVNWYSTTRVCALAAYDWLYNDLTPQERKEILGPLLQHIDDVQPGRGKPTIHRLNGSDHKTGFYGVRNLVWLAGLAGYGDGVNDGLALEFLKRGYQYNQDLFAYRRDCAGDDGGLASATVGYAMGAYPWAQFNFLHTWSSATGENIAPQWPHLALFPQWVYWNWIPSSDGPKEFGSGDTYHYTNDLPHSRLYEHMSQIMHFYGKSRPECAALAAHVRSLCPEQQFSRTWPMYPFLLTELDESPPASDPSRSAQMARCFESLGQISMRSGHGPDDTYCLFTIGSSVPSHKQYDENHFVIYKKGFLALDSGTRGIEKDFQLRHYYAQTAAHNCILIHMPDEPFASYWGPQYEGPEGQTNYGGMNKTTGGRLAAFETNEHYAYVAGDATACYNDQKCQLALRQFVFVKPDYFVICDRVRSTAPEYQKAWLLHTQNEPLVEGDRFRADEGDGRVYCRTLLPKEASLAKVGGPGKEFWANGKNWELNDEMKRRNERQEERTGKPMLLGRWRIEVSSESPQKEDIFLHFIQVGEKTLNAMTESSLVERPGEIGVRFQTKDGAATVAFAAAGAPEGRIQLVSGGQTVVDKPLATDVMPQSGVGSR